MRRIGTYQSRLLPQSIVTFVLYRTPKAYPFRAPKAFPFRAGFVSAEAFAEELAGKSQVGPWDLWDLG